MKNKILLFLFLVTQITLAQTSGITISDLKPAHNNNLFPEIHSAANPKIAEKVNTFLQLEYLEHLPGDFKKHPFEKVSYDREGRQSDGSAGFSEWKKEQTPKNVLSITLGADFTGAYSEECELHHNFDTRTGNLITLKSLIKKEQTVVFNTLLNKKVKKTVDDFLVIAREELKLIDSTNNREEFDRYTEQIRMYDYCMENNDDYELRYYDFYFSKDSLHLIRERCSAHVNRALDDLYEFNLPFSYAEMDKYLSTYGKSLLDNSTYITKTDSPEGKFFKGKIGNSNITVMTNHIEENNTVNIIYWYDKYKTAIEWYGQIENNHFSLKEITPDIDSNLIATIEANWNNGKITGTWTNAKTKKVLKLELTEY